MPETEPTSFHQRRAAAELLDVGWVYVDASLQREDLAWSLAQAIVDHATRSDAIGAGLPAPQIVGRFTVPPPGAECRDFQALHLDFGLPIASNAPTDVVRFTALHIEASHAPTTAGTRIVALGALLTQRRWEAPERLVDRLRRYARAGFVDVEGILGRLIEVVDGTPALPPPGGDLLCGMEFASLAEERQHFADRGLDLDAAEHVLALRPGGLLIFDNLATAHGRLGRRQPLELQQLCLGYRRLDPRHKAVLLQRVIAQFTRTPATRNPTPERSRAQLGPPGGPPLRAEVAKPQRSEAAWPQSKSPTCCVGDGMVGSRLAPGNGGVVQRLPLSGVDPRPLTPEAVRTCALRGVGMSVSSPKPSSASARPTEMPPRKLATITGVLWIITFITSIPAVLLYDPLLNDQNYILGAGGGDTRIFIGATLELLLIIANIGTAVLPFSIFKRYNERLAVGYVTARLVECGFIAVGIVSVLAIMTLRQDPGSASDGTLVSLGQSLVAVHDATFLLGPGIVVGVGNGLILGYLMYTSGLVPPRMAMFGLVGGPLLLVSGIAVMFAAFDINSAPRFVCSLPEIIWEASLGIYLTFKGFRASAPILSESRDTGLDPGLAIAAP